MRTLFNGLVGAAEQSEAERSGGLEIDDELELGWRLRRKTGRGFSREYLFDLLPASLFVYGLKSADELLAFLPRMSLQAQGWLGKPAAPILVVGGTRDTQVPIDDLELLINSGSEPREAWINPVGGHMGRTASTWPDPVIFRQVILPWEVRHLSQQRGN